MDAETPEVGRMHEKLLIQDSIFLPNEFLIFRPGYAIARPATASLGEGYYRAEAYTPDYGEGKVPIEQILTNDTQARVYVELDYGFDRPRDRMGSGRSIYVFEAIKEPNGVKLVGKQFVMEEGEYFPVLLDEEVTMLADGIVTVGESIKPKKWPIGKYSDFGGRQVVEVLVVHPDVETQAPEDGLIYSNAQTLSRTTSPDDSQIV